MLEVGGVARDEIIDADDAKALRQKTVGQMAAQKSGAAGDNCGFHDRQFTDIGYAWSIRLSRRG